MFRLFNLVLNWKSSGLLCHLNGKNKTSFYRKLLKKLDERFGDRELPASAQVRFQQATQKKDESLEDWADRVLTLSGKAFKNLPENYSNQQAVARFCQGLRDTEVGHHVCMKKSLSIEDALMKSDCTSTQKMLYMAIRQTVMFLQESRLKIMTQIYLKSVPWLIGNPMLARILWKTKLRNSKKIWHSYCDSKLV